MDSTAIENAKIEECRLQVVDVLYFRLNIEMGPGGFSSYESAVESCLRDI